METHKVRTAKIFAPVGLVTVAKWGLSIWAAKAGVKVTFKSGYPAVCKLWQRPITMVISGYPTLVDKFTADLVGSDS